MISCSFEFDRTGCVPHALFSESLHKYSTQFKVLTFKSLVVSSLTPPTQSCPNEDNTVFSFTHTNTVSSASVSTIESNANNGRSVTNEEMIIDQNCINELTNKLLFKRKQIDSLSPVIQTQVRKYSQISNPNVSNMSAKSSPNMQSTSSNITTKNRYASLANQDLSTSQQPSQNVSKTAPKTIKVPPIVTIDLNYTQIKSLMTAAKIQKFYIKYMSIGTKLLLENIEDYKNAKNILTQSKSNFYSHDIPNEKTLKFVLSGLHNLPENEVKEHLIAENIKVLEVKKMKSNNTKFVNEGCQYLIYFANDSGVKLNELKSHKYVMGVVVRWSPYINSKSGPTQCSKCQLYGHGNKNCHLPPKCSFCSGEHESLKCNLLNQPSTSSSVPVFIPKCCLCAGAHTARDRECPKRAEYMKMRIKTSEPKIAQNRNNQRVTGFQGSINNKSEFPGITRNHNLAPSTNHWRPVPQQSKTPPVTHVSSAATNYTSNLSDQPNYPDLFSIDELLQLSHDMINLLSLCKNKQEQFRVVADLTIKYLYNSNGK